jgi:hypothetical protein
MADNTSVIPVGYVGPNFDSATKLGAGTYSLNKRSNVPFISLIGSAGYKKTISWGELVDVPGGQLVTVRNASYHGGDIFVNKGRDICNRPSRITVPVQFKPIFLGTPSGTPPAAPALYGADFPCDTRAAKRAYLNIDANLESNSSVYVRGRRLDGSMNTENSLGVLNVPFGPGVGFLSGLAYLLGEQMAYIPLGQGAIASDDSRPHNLLDAGDVFFDLGIAEFPFVPESLFNWPAGNVIDGFPTYAKTLVPGAWYIVEYD